MRDDLPTRIQSHAIDLTSESSEPESEDELTMVSAKTLSISERAACRQVFALISDWTGQQI